MELTILRYFLTLVNEKNISKSAKKLHITQPTLSRQLAELEMELGKKLFTRGSREISLTEDGVFLWKRAKEILELTDKTVQDLSVSDKLIHGEVSIGAGETEAFRLIVAGIKKVRENYPQIRFRIFSAVAQDTIERLNKGLLDFIIIIGSIDKDKYEFITLPKEDTAALLMRNDCKLADKSSISLEDLRDMPLLIPEMAINRKAYADLSTNDFENLNVVATFNLINNAAIMVEEGIGCALCLDKLVNVSGDSNLLFKPIKPLAKLPVYFLWKKYQVFSKASAVFLQQIKNLYL